MRNLRRASLKKVSFCKEREYTRAVLGQAPERDLSIHRSEGEGQETELGTVVQSSNLSIGKGVQLRREKCKLEASDTARPCLKRGEGEEAQWRE